MFLTNYLLDYSKSDIEKVEVFGTLTVAEPLILKNVDYNAMVLS